MKKLLAALACCSAILVLAGGASANLAVGVNDDAPKDGGIAPFFFEKMTSTGLALDALTLRWDETAPTTIAARENIDAAITAAAAAGVSVELDIYPLHSQALTGAARCAPTADPTGCGSSARIAQFGTWVGLVADAFPSVHQWIVMNECNQPLFVNPQWFSNAHNDSPDISAVNQSAQICGRALAAGYDALHAASTSNFVWGVGLSPRGNNLPDADSNSSTKPVTFLKALGSWFKAFAQKTHRTAPLMDGFDTHPYPIPQSLPFATGYPDVLDASVSNLPRLYQAFYDGFNGTPQKTIGSQPGGGLKVSLNEVGVQTEAADHSPPGEVETSANSAGGVIPPYNTETYQANWYKQMLELVSCDPSVAVVNIFHLIDEPSLAGWQSGLYYADKFSKLSAGVVTTWISTTHGRCIGKLNPFTAAATATTTTPTTGTEGTPATGCGSDSILAPLAGVPVTFAITKSSSKNTATKKTTAAGPKTTVDTTDAKGCASSGTLLSTLSGNLSWGTGEAIVAVTATMNGKPADISLSFTLSGQGLGKASVKSLDGTASIGSLPAGSYKITVKASPAKTAPAGVVDVMISTRLYTPETTVTTSASSDCGSAKVTGPLTGAAVTILFGKKPIDMLVSPTDATGQVCTKPQSPKVKYSITWTTGNAVISTHGGATVSISCTGAKTGASGKSTYASKVTGYSGADGVYSTAAMTPGTCVVSFNKGGSPTHSVSVQLSS